VVAELSAGGGPLVLIPEYFGSLVFDRRNSRYMPFDHASTLALHGALENGVGVVVGCERDVERQAALIDFFDYFERLGWLRADGRLAGRKLDATPPADHLLGPLAVHLEIIAACNLRCTHCFAGELPRKTELSLAQMDRLFAELASLGSFRLGLTGGEPLLRKDLLDIVDAATSHGLHPCLTTNGLLIDERIARELGKREWVWLNVSLEGATATSNDRVRGLGTFTEVKRRLRILAEHARFTIAFTITSANAEEVEACAALARELGAHTAVFRPLYPVGVAREHPELMPSFSQYTDALARLAGDLHAIDPFSPQHRANQQARTYQNLGCGAANLVASISASGDVNPCSFLGSEFDGGNLHERSFAEIWSASQVFERLRRTSGSACGFQGGCRARALAAHGSVDAADPWHDEWLARSEAAPRLPPLSNVQVRQGSVFSSGRVQSR
jgi:radical SAM protein with 4Fe4S-binding SPASM domain